MPIPMGIRIDIMMVRLVNIETQYGRKASFESTRSPLLPTPGFRIRRRCPRARAGPVAAAHHGRPPSLALDRAEPVASAGGVRVRPIPGTAGTSR